MAKRRNLSPDDWIRGAMEGLLKEDARGVRISRIARHLGVTPGSFYWHFKDRDAFRDQILRYWMKQLISRAANVATRSGKGAERLRALPATLIEGRLPEYDAAVRRWAATDPAVAAAVEKADELRVRLVSTMFAEAGWDEDAAMVRARVMLWAFVGSAAVDPKLRLRGFETLLESLLTDAPTGRRDPR